MMFDAEKGAGAEAVPTDPWPPPARPFVVHHPP